MSNHASPLSEQVYQHAEELLQWRHHLHKFPELSHHEKETAEFVESTLRSLGIENIRSGIGGYGLIADIEGKQPGKTIGIRADMDALPIEEQTNLPFASSRPGIMHSCGHDAHTTMLLGAARQLKRLADEGNLHGRVRLIFQPAEECLGPNGKSGGRMMVEEGILEGVDAVIGQHVSPSIPAGHYSFQRGPICASSDGFTVTVRGTACHAATPHVGRDAILLASQLIQHIHQVISRRIPPADTGVISIGTIQGGTARNIVADTVTFEGTLRAHRPEVRAILIEEIQKVSAIAEALGGGADVQIIEGYPPLINDIALIDLAESAIRAELGEEAIHDPIGASTGAEDFAFMSRIVPGAFLRIGVKHPDWTSPKGAHTPFFEIDERCLPAGTIGLVAVASSYLHQSATGI